MKKRTYSAPELQEETIDNEISLVMQSAVED